MLLTAAPDRRAQLDQILEHVGGTLDIPQSLRDEAIRFYEAVGVHLSREGSLLNAYSPWIYPQGSFRLGTMIRPVFSGCEYDVDLVCLLLLIKEATTQADLKDIVGTELKLAYAAILEEGRRCWTLQFRTKFHMDVLPAIPNVENGGSAIWLTDTDLTRWQPSDPRAYARWFESRMAVVMRLMKAALALELRSSVDSIPDWRIRTPLQRVIQLLKRHRDLFFKERLEHRPASIIITTLAARAYGGQTSLVDALVSICESLPAAVTLVDGKYRIPNPVCPNENFADRWNEDPAKARHFGTWASAVIADVASWTTGPTAGIHRLSNSLELVFGADVVRVALEGYGKSVAASQRAGVLSMAARSGMIVGPPPSIASHSVRVPAHTFFGE